MLSQDHIWTLKFDVDYYRKMQVERFNQHIEEKKSIASFLYSDAERQLDSLIYDAMLVLDDLKAEMNKPKKFWHRKK